jgi:folate-binding protein YgfZ
MSLTEKLNALQQIPDTAKVIYPLEDFSILKLAGDNVSTFLQGQLTVDVEKMEDNSALLAAHCNPKGRVITLCTLFKIQATFYIVTPTEMLAITQTAFNKYAPFSKVTLTECDDSLCLIGSNTPLTEKHTINWYGHRYIHLMSQDELLAQLTEQQDWKCGTAENWHQQDIQFGLPRIHPQTSEHFIVQRLNLQKIPHAVSMKKGCYVGQEIIARIHFLGQLKHEMIHGECPLDDNITPGDSITLSTGDNIGELVDVIHDSTQQISIFLAIIKQTHINDKLMIQDHSFQAKHIDY